MEEQMAKTLTPEEQKYLNYREQFRRLDKAMKNQFYLEAVFIAYAIMEDRADSILRYENNGIKSKDFVSIDRKLRKIETIARQKKSLPNRYIPQELIENIKKWKEERNKIIHALLRQSLTTQQLAELAEDGKRLARQLSNCATNYKRAVIRKNQNI